MTIKSKLKIMQCAGASLAIRPDLKYAGTERIAYQLNEAFSLLGHDTIMGAPADSDLRGHGKLLPTFEKSLWSRKGNEREIIGNKKYREEHRVHYRICLDFIISNNIDILHDHPGSGIINSDPYLERKNSIDIPIVTTLHGTTSDSQKPKYAIWKKLREEKRPIFFNAISNSQKKIYENEAGIKIDKVIYHGVPLELFDFQSVKQPYLFWIGRLMSDKGTDLAIKIAKKAKRPLIIAGEVHTPNKLFYETELKPFITKTINGNSEEEQELEREKLINKLEEGKEIVGPEEILYVGPLDDRQKAAFYRNAYAMLMPNRWSEPFGLTLIESMASGTPVVGTNLGSLPEIIADGQTGFVVDPEWKYNGKKEMDDRGTIERMTFAINKLGSIPNISQNCRGHVEKNFERIRMAQDYIDFYLKILNKK